MPSARRLRRVHRRRQYAVLLAAALTVLLSACTGSSQPAKPSSNPSTPSASSSSTTPSSAPEPTGLTTHSITVGGHDRTYLVYRPPGLTGSVPLVVMLHGGAGSARGAAVEFGWNAEAAREHFAVAYPDGDKTWSLGGGCCGPPARIAVDDTQFIVAAVHQIESHLDIDRRRVYASGISLGGMMDYHLACTSSTFAAIAPDSATLYGSCSSPHPISVLHIHGTADDRIPYDGSTGDGRQHINGPSVPALNAKWRLVDHCAAPKSTKSGIVTRSIATCPDGRAVELITIAGGGHDWPGARCSARCRQGAADRPTQALDATSTIWSFFAAHPAPA